MAWISHGSCRANLTCKLPKLAGSVGVKPGAIWECDDCAIRWEVNDTVTSWTPCQQQVARPVLDTSWITFSKR